MKSIRLWPRTKAGRVLLISIAAPSLVALGIAAWQNHEGSKTTEAIRSLPRQIAEAMAPQPSAPSTSGPGQREVDGENADTMRFFSATYADVDNDGQDELLVEHGAGAHGKTLRVFGFHDYEMKLMGEIGSGTGAGFTVKDFDGDGRTDIGTRETDWSLDLPYYLAPQMQVWYRWDGRTFVEVATIKDYTQKQVDSLRRELNKP